MAEQIFSYTEAALEDIAARMLALARAGGATAAETDVSEGCGQNVSVRLGEVETIEYNRDKGVSLTVYLGQKKGHASTSDFSDKALADTVDARISNSEGGTVATHATRHCYANSHGYSGSLTTSRHSLSASVVASGANSMQRDYWYSTARHADDLLSAEEVGRIAGERAARHADDLLSAEEVGRIAGERAVRRLDGRRVKTGQYPVLFEAPVAGSLLSHLVQAVSGGSLYRKSSFLLDSLGQQVAASLLNISEDPFVLRGLASGCADDEGVATSARQFVKDGVLQGYFLGSYSARKLGMQSTGHAGGAHNLVVQPTLAGGLAALLARMGTGLLVTELMGQGINMVTGDYSRGASGFWVENGVIAYPVEELTIAGNLRDMLQGIDAIGDDIDYRGSRHMGSVLLGNMMVAGEA